MADHSAIEWCNATWNPVRGCTKVSPGCAHCYAETFAERWRGVKGHSYEQGFDLRLVPEKLDEPLRWKKPRRIFVNSMSDLFQDGVPDSYIDQVFAVMALAPQHTFQVLTKRADRMRAYLHDDNDQDRIGIRVSRAVADLTPKVAAPRGHAAEAEWDAHADSAAEWTWRKEDPFILPNVWLGVSVENQHFADERIPLLLQTPAAVRFISAEPLLGPVNLHNLTTDTTAIGWINSLLCVVPRHLDWVIVGGESGHGARPFDVAWARSIMAQCKAAGVSVFVKQLGTNPHAQVSAAVAVSRPVIPMVLRDRKGGDLAEWPADLRVREFPEARV